MGFEQEMCVLGKLSSESLEYRFEGFRLTGDQQRLRRGDEEISISTKIYYLLLFFLEKPGETLRKEEIIAAVWPDQVVTDATLVRQIARLRKLLSDDDPQRPLIKTHRGVGYRFTANVERRSQTPLTPPPKTASLPAWMKLIALPAIGAVILLATLTYDRYMGVKTSFQTAGLPVSLAIIPSARGENWLSRGGLTYLSDLLSRHKFIHAVSPQPDWFGGDQPDELAIGLTTNSNINYSCLVAIRETKTGFAIDARLQTKADIISGTTIEAVTLPALFDKTDSWITLNLSVRDQIEEMGHDAQKTVDPYALQSYLQGIFEIEVNGDTEKAKEYFQAAVSKDSNFLPAWYRLARTDLELGNFKKAISIATTHLNNIGINVSTKLSFDFQFVKAMAHAKLKEHGLAEESIKLSIASIDASDDPYLQLAGLESLTLLGFLQADWKSAEGYSKRRIAISREHYPLPNHMAKLHVELAMIYDYLDELENMTRSANVALQFYEKNNNSNGMISTLYVMIDLYITQNMLDEGIEIIERAEPYLESCTQLHEKAFFLQAGAYILNLRGHFDHAQRLIEQMRKIATQTGNHLYLFLAEFIQGHGFYVQGRFADSRAYIESMRSAFENGRLFPALRDSFLTKDLIISARIDPPHAAREKLNDYARRYPGLLEEWPSALARADGHIAVREGRIEEGLALLSASEKAHREDDDLQIANYIGYEILAVLIDHPELPYQETIDRLERNTRYDYLFFKFKAQFLAREGNYVEAATLMNLNRSKANQLWKAEDQLLLEVYRQKST